MRDKTERTLSEPHSFNLFLSDKSDRDRYTASIERIRRWNSLEVFYQEVSRQEKDLIVKAMGLTQGHWFKCPKGKCRLCDGFAIAGRWRKRGSWGGGGSVKFYTRKPRPEVQPLSVSLLKKT